MSENDGGGTAPANRSPRGGSIVTKEADRRAVVVQLIEAQVEALSDRQDDLGQQCSAVGVEEPIQGAPELVVAEMLHRLGVNAEHSAGKAVNGLLLAVDGLALDDERTQQHAQGAGMGDGATSVREHEARQRLMQPDALDEVVDQGQRAQPLGAQSEACLLRCGRWGLRANVKDPCRVPLHSASSRPARRSAASAPRSPGSSTCARARCTSARRCAAGRLAAAPRTRSPGTARTTNGGTSRAASSCTG